MAPIPRGTKVRQKVAALTGEVTQTRFNEDKQLLEYHVAGTLGGEDHAKWFAEDELEVLPQGAAK